MEASTALYEAILRFDTQDAYSAFNLGNVLDRRGLVAHADPSFSDAWSNLGMIAERQGRRAEAEELYSRAIAMSPYHTRAKWNLARLLCDEERFTEALPYWERIATQSLDDRAEALKWSRICRAMIARPLQV